MHAPVHARNRISPSDFFSEAHIKNPRSTPDFFQGAYGVPILNSARVTGTGASYTLGWQLEDELREIERVVKAGGYAIHLSGPASDTEDSPLHACLTSPQWQYTYSRYEDKDGWKSKYWKQLSGFTRDESS